MTAGPARCPDCGGLDVSCWPVGPDAVLYVCRMCGKRWTDPEITYRRRPTGPQPRERRDDD